jgi:hypothetical protein
LAVCGAGSFASEPGPCGFRHQATPLSLASSPLPQRLRGTLFMRLQNEALPMPPPGCQYCRTRAAPVRIGGFPVATGVNPQFASRYAPIRRAGSWRLRRDFPASAHVSRPSSRRLRRRRRRGDAIEVFAARVPDGIRRAVLDGPHVASCARSRFEPAGGGRLSGLGRIRSTSSGPVMRFLSCKKPSRGLYLSWRAVVAQLCCPQAHEPAMMRNAPQPKRLLRCRARVRLAAAAGSGIYD